MSRRLIAMSAAILLGVLGVVAVVLYANGADQRAVAGAEPRTVFVSDKAVPLGTSLNDAVANGLIVQTSLPAKAVPAGILTSVTDANKGLLAISDIPPGEYILTARFGPTPQANTAIRVPQGQVAMSVPLSDPAHVGTFVAPGSRIVLYATTGGGAAANGANGTTTHVLFDDVVVIAVGTTAFAQAQPTGEATSAAGTGGTLVTVALSPEQGQKLAYALQTSTLYAGLLGNGVKGPAGVVNGDNAFPR